MQVAKPFTNFIPSSQFASINEKEELEDTAQDGFYAGKCKIADILEAQGSKISNHYEVPNMASMLYEFTNKEADHVHMAFRVGNFVSLRDLPNAIMPGNVSLMQSSKMEENLYSVMERKTYVELANNGGYFSKFEWQADPYGIFKE